MLQQELIREVEMGPFKHKVDDGLDIRKAAFECMYTLLDTCLDRLDIFDFLQHLQHGLWDHYDIKMLAYLMVARLAQLAPSAVLQSKLVCLFIFLYHQAVMLFSCNGVSYGYARSLKNLSGTFLMEFWNVERNWRLDSSTFKRIIYSKIINLLNTRTCRFICLFHY